MNVQLRPSFVRCTASVTVAMVGVSVMGYFWQGYFEQHWWTRDYILSLFIPCGIAPIAVWLIFVPSRFEFSETEFTIKLPFRPLYKLAWSDLKHYGEGLNVFMMEFSKVSTFQIFPQAFHKSEWRMLTDFLASTYPDKKASGSVGTRMFRWPWRKDSMR